jgi:hypothetical protein
MVQFHEHLPCFGGDLAKEDFGGAACDASRCGARRVPITRAGNELPYHERGNELPYYIRAGNELLYYERGVHHSALANS